MLHFNNPSIEPSSVPLKIPAPAAGKPKKKRKLIFRDTLQPRPPQSAASVPAIPPRAFILLRNYWAFVITLLWRRQIAVTLLGTYFAVNLVLFIINMTGAATHVLDVPSLLRRQRRRGDQEIDAASL